MSDLDKASRTFSALVDFAAWLVRMDDPNNPEGVADRQVVTLTAIIERARAALQAGPPVVPDEDRVPVGPGRFLERKPGESDQDFGHRADVERMKVRAEHLSIGTDTSRDEALRRATAVWHRDD